MCSSFGSASWRLLSMFACRRWTYSKRRLLTAHQLVGESCRRIGGVRQCRVGEFIEMKSRQHARSEASRAWLCLRQAPRLLPPLAKIEANKFPTSRHLPSATLAQRIAIGASTQTAPPRGQPSSSTALGKVPGHLLITRSSGNAPP